MEDLFSFSRFKFSLSLKAFSALPVTPPISGFVRMAALISPLHFAFDHFFWVCLMRSFVSLSV